MLADKNVIIGTSSKPRVALITSKGIKAEFIASTYEEDLERNTLTPHDFVMLTAHGKAHEVFLRYPDSVVVGCDTMLVNPETSDSVTTRDRLIGKPRGATQEEERADAKRIITHLSGRSHYIMTGVSILFPYTRDLNEKDLIEHLPHIEGLTVQLKTLEDNKVTFRTLSEADIEAYLDLNDYQGKAGAYGYQSEGKVLMEHVEGSTDTVIGFPTEEYLQVYTYLNKL